QAGTFAARSAVGEGADDASTAAPDAKAVGESAAVRETRAGRETPAVQESVRTVPQRAEAAADDTDQTDVEGGTAR
ncbi:hypothetical protein, partial [Streptomyces sp. HD]|uniref:hypothetical protein n=1 Tax=Streptomyces sp. HD TaxID=3020892 RepID=UPI00232F5199